VTLCVVTCTFAFAIWVRGPARSTCAAPPRPLCLHLQFQLQCGACVARRVGYSCTWLLRVPHLMNDRWTNNIFWSFFLKYIICIDYSVANKILFFLNSLFLNSCSLKYYRQRGAAAATASRVTHFPVLYCDQHEFNQSNVYHSLHSIRN
jgi:hypothetical protein